MLTKLTPQMEAMKPIVQNEWFTHGWSTAPANREEAERGVRLAYEAANLPHPEHMIWMGSPLTGAIAAGMLHDKHATIDNVHDKVNEWLRLSETGKLPKGWKQCVLDWRWRRIGGQHWAGYYSYYDFYNHTTDELREIVKPLTGQMIVAKNAGWWWVFERAAIITERPTELHMTTGERSERVMHNTTGPAIRYPDGFELYYVNGVSLSRMQHTGARERSLSPAEILRESNTEQRRVMIDLYGPARFAQDADPVVVDDDSTWGRLLRIDVPNDEPIVMVDVKNNTCETCTRSIGEATLDTSYAERCQCEVADRKPYLLRVPPQTCSTLEGLAWMAETTPEEYAARITAQA